MSGLIIWRLVKYLGMALVAAGAFSGFVGDVQQRQRLGLGAATLGWLVTWTAGWGLVKLGGHSMGASWVSAALLFSLLGFAGSAAAATGRHRGWTGLAVGGLVATITVMTLKTHPLAHPIALGLGAVFGGLAVPFAVDPGEPSKGAVAKWFGAIAWMEGVSLLLLFGLYMPAKRLMHLELDGGQGWFGWIHGMLVMGYVAALIITAVRLRWRFRDGVLGFLASLLPFGTFWFERRMLHGSSKP